MRFVYATTWRRLDDGGLDDLADWLEHAETPRLVIVDTFTAIRPRTREHGFVEDYQALCDLQKLAGQYRVAIVVIHHLRKAAADDPVDTISGTLGLAAAVDTLIVIRGRGKECRWHLRGRDVEDREFAASFDKDSCRWTLSEDHEDPLSRTRRQILTVLAQADEPLPPGEIAALTDLPANTVRQRLFQMKADGQVAKIGAGYCLPENKQAFEQAAGKARKSGATAGSK